MAREGTPYIISRRVPIAIAKEGLPYVISFTILGLACAAIGAFAGGGFYAGGRWWWWIAAACCFLLAAFMAFFFRDPERQSPTDDRIIISPADGRITNVALAEPGVKDSPTQISIFLSPLNVHINRSPIAGEITEVVYKKGKYHMAWRDIASVENEQTIVTIEGRYVRIVFRQITGVLARRIVFWKKQGDTVAMGERVGLMKFSSRMDVIVPSEVEVFVHEKDRVVAGVTVLGRVRSD